MYEFESREDVTEFKQPYSPHRMFPPILWYGDSVVLAIVNKFWEPNTLFQKHVRPYDPRARLFNCTILDTFVILQAFW